MIYVRVGIASKQFAKHKLPNDIEGIFIEINLWKTKWVILGTYHPPSQSVEYFFKHLSFALDTYRQTYEKFLLAGGFNSKETEPCLSEFLSNYGSTNLVEDKTCFKNP